MADKDLETLSSDFSLFDNWEDRYGYLIDLGKKIPALPDDLKVEENLVSGCTSRVWLVCSSRGDKLEFLADSDAMIVKGLIAIILAAYNGKTPQEILETDIQLAFSDIGLDQHLSPNRRNGFFSMVEKIKSIARSYV
jgi:cysteine desulfuration protein SufE